MNTVTLWWLRNFKVITAAKAESLDLIPYENIYGDEINKLSCRSIWKDKKGRTYRVQHLVNLVKYK